MNAPATNHAPSQPGLLPPAARRQVEEANRMVAELKGKGHMTGGDPPVAQPAAPAVAAQPAPSVAAVAAAPPAAEPTVEQRLALSEQRYASLKGKFDQEIGATRQINAEQSRLITQLLDREPAAPAAAAAPAAPQTPAEILKSLGATDKEIEDYGELLPIVARLAQNMFRPTLQKLETELAAVRAAAGTTSKELVKTKQAEVFHALDAACPNWRVINEEQEFLDWLSIVDIFSGVTRRVALTSAFNALDANRVSGIFQAYVREDARRGTASGGPTVDAESLVAPGSPRGGATAAPGGAGGKKIWSEQEIKNFYTRVRKKQVSAEDYASISQEIAVAVAEGRVKPDRVDIHQNSR